MIIKQYIGQLTQTLNLIDIDQVNAVRQSFQYIKENQKDSNIFVIGNGGSATTADHFALDLLKAAGLKGRSLTATPNLTAYANDEGYHNVYTEQLRMFSKPGDFAVLVSTSGKSQNITEAALFCQMSNVATIGLTACDGGPLKKMVDISVHVPTENVRIAEDCHLIICHSIIDDLIGGMI